MDKKIHNLQEFHDYVADLAKHLPSKAILLLNGEMGVGKTEFVKSLGQAWEMNQISSPTFAIHHQYKSKLQTLDHFDLYRIKTREELEGTGFWDVLAVAEGVVAIEWPRNLQIAELPKDVAIYRCDIEKRGDERSIKFKALK